MSQQVFANLTAKMDLESAKFQRELKTASKQTVRFKKDAKAANDSTTRFSTALKKAGDSAALVTGPLGGVSSRLSILSRNLTSVGVAGMASTAAISALGFAVAQSVKVFSEYEQGQLKTQALIQSTGSSAGRTAKQIEDLAASVALSTLASVDGARKAAHILQSFKSVSGSVFDEALKTSQDMASVFGGDMASNAKMLGKALEDPIKGINAMTRAGVSFNDSEKARIKTMVEAGQVAQAQGVILDALAGQIGGAGSAEAGGVAGAVDTLSQRWDELMLSIANTTESGKGATWFFNALAAGINSTSEAIDPSPQIQMNNLLKQRVELQDRLKVLDSRKNQNDDKLKLIRKKVNAELAINTAAMRKFQDARQAEQLKETAAAKAAEDAKIKRQKETEQRLLAISQNEGSKRLAQIDRNLATQTQKMAIDYQTRKKAIEDLVLSKVEIEKQGFDSIEQLRASYLERAKEAHKSELLAYQESQQTKDKIKTDQLAREAQRLASLKSAQEQEVTQIIYQEQIKKQIKAGLKTEEQAQEEERLKEQLARMQENFDQQLLLIGTNEEAKKVLLNKFRADNEIAVAQSERNMSAIKNSEDKARVRGGVSALQQNLQAIAGNSKKGAAIAKTAAISQATIKTYESATSAYSAMAGIPYIGPALGVAAAAAAVAAGMANVSSIRSQPIAGAREKGGHVLGGKTYLVGERGPELFTAGASGQITSNANLNKAIGEQQQVQNQNVAVNYHFHGDAEQNERMLQNNRNATIRDARRLTDELNRPY